MGIFHQKHDEFFNFSVCNIETIRFLVICGLFLGVFLCWQMLAPALPHRKWRGAPGGKVRGFISQADRMLRQQAAMHL